MKPTFQLLSGEIARIHPPCHATYYKPLRNDQFMSKLERRVKTKFPGCNVSVVTLSDKYILKVEG